MMIKFMISIFTVIMAGLVWVFAAEEKADRQNSHKIELNALLVNQAQGTWLKLPDKGTVRPDYIHGHAGAAIDTEKSVLHFFGSDTHDIYWNNDVWSYDIVSMRWKQSYRPDNRTSYQYKNGCRSTTTGHPWSMHTFSMNNWDPISKAMIVSARPIHYGLSKLPQVQIPKTDSNCWWHYSPDTNTWSFTPDAPALGLGHLCYLPTYKRFIAFNGDNAPVTFYDSKQRAFEKINGKAPPLEGYTLKSVYDSKRNRVLLISWDTKSRLWAFDLEKMKWIDLKAANTPVGGIYGSWDYDASADVIVSLWPADPDGGFDNSSGKSRTIICDLEKNEWMELQPDTAPPYRGMSFKVAYDPRHKVTFYVDRNTVWSFKAPKLKSP